MDHLHARLEALESRVHALDQQARAVDRRLCRWRRLAWGLGVFGLLGWTLQAVTAGDAPVFPIPERLAVLEHKLTALTFDAATNEVRITGANLRLVNGLGATETTNGTGNLLVGYPEPGDGGETGQPGSHNVVVGTQHRFSSFGGLVVGRQNELRGAFAAVSGGSGNTASGEFSSVSGGQNRTATGAFDWVAGSLFEDE
jgi:hypothetical protein